MTELGRFARFFGEILGLTFEPFQVEITKEVFSDRRETVILIPRGCGKSSLLGAIGLWHLLTAPNPRAVVGAASREQAGVLFDIVRDFAAHPAVAKRVEVTRREIRTQNGWLRVVASDGPKQHGLILSLAIVDELHAHRDGELYTALRTGMLKRDDARMVTISTAGSHADTPLGRAVRPRAAPAPGRARRDVDPRGRAEPRAAGVVAAGR